MLYVEKGGEIIPKITGVDIDAREAGAEQVRFVTRCPDCGSELVRIPGEAAWQCPNKYGCRPQIIGRLEHFVGRHMMDIEGVGEENCVLLYDAGLVRNIADFYTLEAAGLERLDRIGPRTAQRIIEGVEASRNVPFERVLFALSIPYVGETVSRKLARAVRDIDTLMAMTNEELVAIDDIGPRIAEALAEYFSYEPNREIVARLKDAGVRLRMADVDESDRSDSLAGQTIVISGVFSRHSREEYKEMIEKNGGKNAGSISKKTSFVLAGDNMGPSKLEKARSLGVRIVNEDEFLKMI